MSEPRLLVERTWRSDVVESTERFRLLEMPDGYHLTGSTTITCQHEPVKLVYLVETGSDWRTRSARIRIPDDGFDIRVDMSGRWWINGRRRPDLGGCIDIDLGWTPATNTLPIRRTGAQIDHPVTTRAAWLQWPDLSFTAANQTYTKRNDGTWTYQQGDFTADLEVDRHGVVIAYGSPPIWYPSSSLTSGDESGASS